MLLDPVDDAAKLVIMKNWINANHGGVFDQTTVAALNALASPAYRVHRSDVLRAEIYKTTVPAADSSSGAETTWVWAGYKVQSVPEQNSWTEMFMSIVTGQIGRCDFNNLNNRKGVLEIFGTAGNGGANRVHIFNVARRRATFAEALYTLEVVSPPANTGNTTGQPRGSIANPDMLGVNAKGQYLEGLVTIADVINASNAA